ncbi:DUF2982 domain-containing protein [Pseudoalteromonas sp. SSDWG2]|uniref:DUF2982 domain-containing protein n=1 Tax=Pseudoalteromonas sp. SSDWG2 TaxID=3139391 RepID=UPI003BACC5C9
MAVNEPPPRKPRQNPPYSGAKIRALGARFGKETLLLSIAGLLVLSLFVQFAPGQVSLVAIFLLTTAIVGIIIGYLKIREPFFSLFLDNQKLSYNHKYGWWQIDVHNIAKVGVPHITVQAQQIDLNVVGITLKDEDAFLKRLSPRLAGRLLVEQRHYLMQAIKAYCQDGKECPAHWLVEDTEYTSTSGYGYTGLLAMFANRMNNLKFLTGYDILLPASALDRDIWAFSYLLHRWQLDPEHTVATLREELNTQSGK